MQPLQPELDRIAALKTKDDLAGLLAHDQLIGVNAFLNFGEQQDFANASQQIAAVDQGGLGLPERDYYLRTGAEDDKIRDQYVEHVANIFKLLGEPEAKAKDAQQGDGPGDGAGQGLAGHHLAARPRKYLPHDDGNDLERLSPAIDWSDFFCRHGRAAVTELNVTYPPFFKALNSADWHHRPRDRSRPICAGS